ncbi:MAG TPA: DoxX family protein [Galbitalea sp.]
MNVGILLLRLALAVILVAHSSQKTLGWFHGLGIEKQSAWFANLGLKPGRPFVTVAATAEVLAAISIATGFLTPLGALLAAGTMIVAGMTMHLNAGRIWNAAGGGEYPYMLAVIAIVIAFVGPGRFSLDQLIVRAVPSFSHLDSGALVGVIVAVVAVLGAIPFAMVIVRSKRAATVAGDADAQS